jgi:hypothetical protein
VLLEGRADPESPNPRRHDALLAGLRPNGDVEGAQVLLKAGAKVDAPRK